MGPGIAQRPERINDLTGPRANVEPQPLLPKCFRTSDNALCYRNALMFFMHVRALTTAVRAAA